ncbi:hypothetical protein JCM18899A_53730 [Nocardioides sp. AN3]
MILDLGPGHTEVLAVWARFGPYVVDNWCPHRPRRLDDAVIRGNALICRGHERAFSLECGLGRTAEQLRRYPAWVEGDILVIDLSRSRGLGAESGELPGNG